MRAPQAARSWRDHLAPGVAFDPAGGVPGGGLPTAWGRAWSAAPGAPVLRVSGARPEEDRWMTADELAERTGAVADRLTGFGLGAGSVVLWSPDRSAAAVVSHVGALRAGATVVPVNPALTGRELRYLVGDLSPSAAVVGEPATAGLLLECRVPAVFDHDLRVLGGVVGATGAGGGAGDGLDGATGGDPALVCYTSGTTGAPKGAVLSHANLLANCCALAAAWRWEPDDRLVHVLPLFHGHGLCAALYTTLLVGASTVLLPAFDVEGVIDALCAHTASLFFGVPTMYHRISAAGRAGELASLRLAVSGSAPLAVELHRRMAAVGTDVLERYGMTETLLTVSNPVEGERRAGTVGFPLPGVEVQIDGDGGELSVRGPQVFGGYLGRPQQNAEAFVDGWFRTGDLAEVDDGYVRILGRAGELIISGGFNVYPAEVEDVLLLHPAVTEVAVTGTPSEEWGEVVTAWVVCAEGALDDQSLLRFAAEQLAPYKRPRLVHRVESLPRNAMGKVLRSELS